MKNKRIVFCALIVALSIACFSFVITSGSHPEPTDNEYKNLDLYEAAFAKATDEQKLQIQKIVDDLPSGAIDERRVKIVLGELPSDQPRIDLDKAKEIIRAHMELKQEKGIISDELISEFNQHNTFTCYFF